MRYRYWDACAALGWLKAEADKVGECQNVIDHAENGDVTLITSALTIAEVLYLKGSSPIPKSDREKVRRFFENEYIEVHDVDRTVAERAQDVIWDHGIKPKDAIHVATALLVPPSATVEQFDTFDGSLIALDGQLGTPPLRIGRPNLPSVQQPLFPEDDAPIT